MTFDKNTLRQIYDRSTGYCHLCHKKLAFKDYGRFGARAAWEVEHSNPKAKGGTNRLSNLYPACIGCNRKKQDGSTRSFRSKHGKKRAPLSRQRRKAVKQENAATGAMIGGAVGWIFGPVGAAIGAAVGANLGHKKNPDS